MLFEITRAQVAVFGEKDFQQLQVIRNVVRDFNLPLAIVGHPTVRDTDGLALSSRNRFLSAQDREIAKRIPQTLFSVRKQSLENPDLTISQLLSEARAALAPLEIQYLEITDGPNMKTALPTSQVRHLEVPRIFLAVKLGNTRLIDNIALKEEAE
ncbi:MAG: hypothetical protein EBZ49_13715 [Proteobacteria bacterium]|nr:hypothetical protein [Pseudomonadota bacterium]